MHSELKQQKVHVFEENQVAYHISTQLIFGSHKEGEAPLYWLQVYSNHPLFWLNQLCQDLENDAKQAVLHGVCQLLDKLVNGKNSSATHLYTNGYLTPLKAHSHFKVLQQDGTHSVLFEVTEPADLAHQIMLVSAMQAANITHFNEESHNLVKLLKELDTLKDKRPALQQLIANWLPDCPVQLILPNEENPTGDTALYCIKQKLVVGHLRPLCDHRFQVALKMQDGGYKTYVSTETNCIAFNIELVNKIYSR
jgi:hypothetical protein